MTVTTIRYDYYHDNFSWTCYKGETWSRRLVFKDENGNAMDALGRGRGAPLHNSQQFSRAADSLPRQPHRNA